MCEKIDTTKEQQRQLDLEVWCVRNGVRKSELARQLGVSAATVTYVFQGKRRAATTIDKFVDAGIPRHLLPEPNNGKAEAAA